LYFFVIIGGAVLHATQPRWLTGVSGWIRRRSVVLVTSITSAGLLLLILAILLSRPDGKLHIWMLDVGHSNAVLMQTPNGAHILIDGGTFPSRLLTALGDRLPFNDREIELLVITKPDQNTYSALTAVLTRYDIGVALLNGQTRPTEAFTALQTQLAVHETVTVRAGYTVKTDDAVEIEVLHPQSTPNEDAALNDHALVLRVRYGEFSLLLASDVSAVGQEALLAAGYDPSAAVLQLPNHGSEGSLSATLLSAVQPQIALLQADIANRDGDPDAATLAQLGEIPLYRTDLGGTIHLWTDGTAVWVLQNR
jgi:competence protein ComEC